MTCSAARASWRSRASWVVAVAAGSLVRGGPGGGGGPPGGGGAGAGGRGGGGGGPPGGGAAGGGRGGRGGRRGGGGSGLLSQLELLDVKFKLEKLGAGEAIDGRPTQHYRITTDYRIVWGDQGFPAHAVTEIWTTPAANGDPESVRAARRRRTVDRRTAHRVRAQAARHPRAARGHADQGRDDDDVHRHRDVVGLRSYVGNDPTITNPKLTVVQQTQITNIAPADVDPKLLVVPDASNGENAGSARAARGGIDDERRSTR